MAKKEVATDLWVHDLLVQADISLDVKEILNEETDKEKELPFEKSSR